MVCATGTVMCLPTLCDESARAKGRGELRPVVVY